VVDDAEYSLAQVVRRFRRADLAFLAERVREEHPGLGADWWDEMMDNNEDHEDEDEDR
jgi:hypothetical protein